MCLTERFHRSGCCDFLRLSAYAVFASPAAATAAAVCAATAVFGAGISDTGRGDVMRGIFAAGTQFSVADCGSSAAVAA